MVTVYVTDRKIPCNLALKQKLDLMIKRCTQKKPKSDNLTQIEGSEGVGKTTMSAFIGYYVHYETGRPFSNKNVFFDTKKAIKFAQDTEGQIIIFDEPAIDVLSNEWWKEVQKDLIKLLMIARKRRHFFIFNFAKFWKFAEYIVVDRATSMIHVYENPATNTPLFCYIGKNSLQYLYNDYKTKKQRNYRKYMWFNGDFPDVLDPENSYNILDIFDVQSYEKEKDEVINAIGKKKEKPETEVSKKLRLELRNIKSKIGHLTFPIPTKAELMRQFHISSSTLREWNRLEEEIIENNLENLEEKEKQEDKPEEDTE